MVWACIIIIHKLLAGSTSGFVNSLELFLFSGFFASLLVTHWAVVVQVFVIRIGIDKVVGGWIQRLQQNRHCQNARIWNWLHDETSAILKTLNGTKIVPAKFSLRLTKRLCQEHFREEFSWKFHLVKSQLWNWRFLLQIIKLSCKNVCRFKIKFDCYF